MDAARHPQQVSQLVLHGGYARGRLVRRQATGKAAKLNGQWHAALEATRYESRTSYNALDMVERSIDARGNTQQQVYDLAGQLASSSLSLKGQANELILASITYSAAGKVLQEVAGNGVVARYEYEPQTQRLNRVLTRK